jgi:drug/metabolite transporter (DMT)-like permease
VLLMAPLVVALGAALRLAMRRLRQDKRPIAWLRIGAAAGLAGTAVQGLFETGLRIPANGLLAALLAGILLHAHHDR